MLPPGVPFSRSQWKKISTLSCGQKEKRIYFENKKSECVFVSVGKAAVRRESEVICSQDGYHSSEKIRRVVKQWRCGLKLFMTFASDTLPLCNLTA